MAGTMPTRDDITLLLRRVDSGQTDAMQELMRVVYDDLERMAAAHLRQRFGERAESFLHLLRQRKGFDNRGQFFAIATKIMLRVLMDYRRQKMAAKRGGDSPRFTLAVDRDAAHDNASTTALVDVEALSQALERLDRLDPRKADIVKMRVVWGMTVPQVAEALDVSPSSIDRDWRFAKAWIADEVGLISE